MKSYELKRERSWAYCEPATNRQLKVVKFFYGEKLLVINKGVASGVISRIFSSPEGPENRDLWLKYVYQTGDSSQGSPDLLPFDLGELKQVVIPSDWKPSTHTQSRNDSEEYGSLQAVVEDILREGSPFDDPIPPIEFPNKFFCFTGAFTSATRDECHEVVMKVGAIPHKSVTNLTDYLVVGDNGSKGWAHAKYGCKIEKAMILRMKQGKPAIISETEWRVSIPNR